jgi:hypothetical protein
LPTLYTRRALQNAFFRQWEARGGTEEKPPLATGGHSSTSAKSPAFKTAAAAALKLPRMRRGPEWAPPAPLAVPLAERPLSRGVARSPTLNPAAPAAPPLSPGQSNIPPQGVPPMPPILAASPYVPLPPPGLFRALHPAPPPTSSRLGRTADRGGVSRPRRLRLSGGRHRRRGIARDAFIKTIADLADLGISDLGTLTPGQMHAVFEIYATHAIEAPITNDVGTKSIILPADVRAVASVRGAAPRFHPPKRQRCRRGRGCRRTPPA